MPGWKIFAMLASIPPDQYLDEVRLFETHHIAEATQSPDWGKQWRDWCWKRFKRPEMRCAFCDKPDAERPVMCNPEDESTQKFRWFCNSWCQAQFETNQPRPQIEEPGLFGSI